MLRKPSSSFGKRHARMPVLGSWRHLRTLTLSAVMRVRRKVFSRTWKSDRGAVIFRHTI